MMRFSIENVKPKVSERGRNLKNSHELFRKTRKGVLGLFPFILFQWMKILSKYFAGFDLGVLRNADLNWFISAEEQK